MIFCFSATGNSRYAADQIAAAMGDRVIDIGRALRDKHFDYDVTGDTSLGFVIPTFAWTLPGAVAIFIQKLRLTGYAGQYVYGVFTCGASSGSESAALNTVLKSKGVAFNGSFDLVMPDNFIVWSDAPAPSRLESMLARADKALEGIIGAVSAHREGSIGAGVPKELCMPMEEVSTSKKSTKFFLTDGCDGCGLCREICPMGCIRASDGGQPAWEGVCTTCLACLHRCPQKAIQYGHETVGKERYINPRADLSKPNQY